jgi:hypothetical protein
MPRECFNECVPELLATCWISTGDQMSIFTQIWTPKACRFFRISLRADRSEFGDKLKVNLFQFSLHKEVDLLGQLDLFFLRIAEACNLPFGYDRLPVCIFNLDKCAGAVTYGT